MGRGVLPIHHLVCTDGSKGDWHPAADTTARDENGWEKFATKMQERLAEQGALAGIACGEAFKLITRT